MPRPFGRGPFSAGPWPERAVVYLEVGGVCLFTFDASGAAAFAWARLPAICGAGTWAPMPPCGGRGIDQRPYSAGAYSAGPWPDDDTLPWQPIDVCNTGSWTKTRLPELEPA